MFLADHNFHYLLEDLAIGKTHNSCDLPRFNDQRENLLFKKRLSNLYVTCYNIKQKFLTTKQFFWAHILISLSFINIPFSSKKPYS